MLSALLRRTRQTTPDLHAGDRLTQAEFHRRYVGYPDDTRFELIGGIVFMASPVSTSHSRHHSKLNQLVAHYEDFTEGVEALDNGTVILSDDSEVQPDVSLRVLPEFGGRTSMIKGKFVSGPPEWVGEVAYSSVSIDLHRKKDVYQATGVQEYFVHCIKEQEVHWFNFKSRRQIAADAQGVLRSRVFHGLWIDKAALLARDGKKSIRAVDAGLASREHGEFVQRLRAARKGR